MTVAAAVATATAPLPIPRCVEEMIDIAAHRKAGDLLAAVVAAQARAQETRMHDVPVSYTHLRAHET